MKIFKHIINGIIWSVCGLYVLIITLIHIPAIQNRIGELTASVLSEKLGTQVHVSTIDLGFLNRIIIDDVLIYDLHQKEMVKAARISAKIDLIPLLENRISISSVQIFGTHITLYQPADGAHTNFQFVIDSLSSKDDNKAKYPIDLRINTFIMQHSSIRFDRYSQAPTNERFNTAHLNFTDISAHISLKALKEDSLNIIVKKLAFKEHSGLQLNRLELKAEANKEKFRLHDLALKLPHTDIRIDTIEATYRIQDGKFVPGTPKYRGAICISKITPSDFSCFLSPLKSFTNTIILSSDFNGSDTEIQLPVFKIKSNTGELNVDVEGFIKDLNKKTQWSVNMKDISLSQDFANRIAACCKAGGLEVPDIITHIGRTRIYGNATSDGTQIKSECEIEFLQVGNISIAFSVSDKHDFVGEINTEKISLNTLLNNDRFGNLAASITFNGILPQNKTLHVVADGRISAFDYNNYTYRDISLHSTLNEKNVSGSLKINDPNIALDIEGGLNMMSQIPNINVKASLRNFSPAETKLTEQWGDARFDANIAADFRATGLNDASGFVSLTDFSMTSTQDNYALERMDINSGYKDGHTHFLTLNSDFGEAEILGNFEYKTLAQSVINIVKHNLPTMPGLRSSSMTTGNNFFLDAKINNTDWLVKLLNIPLHIESKMILKGKLDDSSRQLTINCDIPSFKYNGKQYRNGDIEVTSLRDTLRSCIGVTKKLDSGNDLELRLTADATANNLLTSFAWDNNAKKRMSGIFNAKTRFFSNEENKDMARIEIQPSHINIDNTVWSIEPSTITYMKNNVKVEQFAITNDQQHIIVNGTASDNYDDSLSVDLQSIDIEYILDLVNFHSVDFSGKATGRAYISAPFGSMSAYGTITVDDFKFENGRMGVLNANVNWDKQEKQVNINAIAADGQSAMTFINGYVSPTHNNIDLSIMANGTSIEFLQSFTNSFTRYITGNATGEVRLAGPLSNMNLTGELVVDGETTIRPTNCKYLLHNDTVRFIPNEIQLNTQPFYDINGNTGTLSGSIYHNHLTNLSYDMAIKAYNLQAYNFSNFGDDSFYGTVYGTGEVGIRGRSGEVNINIDITPQRNSTFVYNASIPDAIANQEFIQWNDLTPIAAATDSILPQTTNQAKNTRTDIPSDMHINFTINCTPEATIKVLMDNKTNDYITLNGNGTIRATYYNKGSFNMFGTYTVEHGTYGITIQDIIKKNFTFNEGGKIVFGGDPYDASLNLQAIHTVNGVSLSDLNIGKSFSNNTIRVNCLMNISGQPKAPIVDFDIDMPTVSSDEKQMIRSIINSEDEMNQQVVYLLGIGRFYPQEANNASVQSESLHSHTSLAMQSLLSGTISSQINSVLSTVVNSSNWNFGANISTGDEGWNNAEYEGLLSGRLLNNRLLINGQFGYRDNVNNATSSFIGDFDIRYLLHPNGNLAINIYNKTNDRYFTKSSLNTQGIGLIMKKDFNGMKDLFNIRQKKKRKSKTP